MLLVRLHVSLNIFSLTLSDPRRAAYLSLGQQTYRFQLRSRRKEIWQKEFGLYVTRGATSYLIESSRNPDSIDNHTSLQCGSAGNPENFLLWVSDSLSDVPIVLEWKERAWSLAHCTLARRHRNLTSSGVPECQPRQPKVREMLVTRPENVTARFFLRIEVVQDVEEPSQVPCIWYLPWSCRDCPEKNMYWVGRSLYCSKFFIRKELLSYFLPRLRTLPPLLKLC